MFYGKTLAETPAETGGIGLFQYNVMMQPDFHLDSMWLRLLREYQRVWVCTRDNGDAQKCSWMATLQNNIRGSGSSGLNTFTVRIWISS